MARVGSYTQQRNGRTVRVREHDRRGLGGAGVIAGVGVGALVVGVAPSALAAGLVVAFALWAAHRWPDETRVVGVALGKAREHSGRVLRSARRSVVSRAREAHARRERKYQFEREVLVPLSRLGEHPELLALAVDALAEGDEPEGVLAYTQQAAAAVRRSGRKRELAARVRKIHRRCRHLSERLDVQAAYAQTLWRASPSDWVSGEIGRAKHRKNKQMTKIDKVARAAELKALGQLAEGRITKEASDALQSAFDTLLSWQGEPTDPSVGPASHPAAAEVAAARHAA